MKIQIRRRFTNKIFIDCEAENKKEACEQNKKNLHNADLLGADLRVADLRGANLPFIEPIPDLDKKILDRIESGKGLEMGIWHTCKTTHCRGGWAITLHPAGRTLEDIYGSAVAASLIYNASYPKDKIPDFYASNADALAEIKKRASQ